ncbi:chorismate mutase [Sphingosinicella rhizophila]|uniref:chorismate mutase n=1 Tax=Sphingosinicella rhizophila TaxID=3050082 RepID=A0ABU3Q512_9SPHN|nr:chorismate mutase [Sphingosinicella sp. GR2756]MDT9598500.1 chorismate mutase [Sphingosinicella sp. GR2756]
MTVDRVRPDACRTMAEVRQGIDRLDEELVALLGERFRYMEAAARIKPDRASVRDEVRKAEVIANARRSAAEMRVPIDLVGDLYDRLIEGSIAYEFEHFDAIRS